MALLHERAQRLELELTQAEATGKLVEKQGLPRLFWVEGEFRIALRQAELAYVYALVGDIESGSLEGLSWWRAVHEHGAQAVPHPPRTADLPPAASQTVDGTNGTPRQRQG